MDPEYFTFDPIRQEKSLDKMDEVLLLRGREWRLFSRQDVVILAVERLLAEIQFEECRTHSLLDPPSQMPEEQRVR